MDAPSNTYNTDHLVSCPEGKMTIWIVGANELGEGRRRTEDSSQDRKEWQITRKRGGTRKMYRNHTASDMNRI